MSIENRPLLPTAQGAPHRRKWISTSLILACLLGGCLFLALGGEHRRQPLKLPKGDLEQAKYWLSRMPVIDGHIDLGETVRTVYQNDLDRFDLNKPTIGHVDVRRIRKGQLGGFFWSVYVDCKPENANFTQPSYRVRDTLEQIDISKLLIEKYSDTFRFCETAQDVRDAISDGKVASLLGAEGAHQLGSSLGVLRQLYSLGVRYLTLTHSCNNAFADSAGVFEPVKPVHGGLSELGRELIYEMNRLGMLIDISHVSDATALQALELTRAPVMWSHSSARHFNNISRNVPDHVLRKIGRGKGKVDGVVMVNIYPAFMLPNPEHADVNTVADHVEWIANVIGKEHVGIGSDFDGIETTPKGLEDVSKYPNLFAELIRRGWSGRELMGLSGQNILRVLEGAEQVAAQMKMEGAKPSMAIYDKRTDIKRD